MNIDLLPHLSILKVYIVQIHTTMIALNLIYMNTALIMIAYMLPVSYALLSQASQSMNHDSILGMNNPSSNSPGIPTQHYHDHLYSPTKSTLENQTSTSQQTQPTQQPIQNPSWISPSSGRFPLQFMNPASYPSMNSMIGGNFNPFQNPFMNQFPSQYPMPFRSSPYYDPISMRMMMQRRMMGMPMPPSNMLGDSFRSMGPNMMTDSFLYASQSDSFSSMPGIQNPSGTNTFQRLSGINDPMPYGLLGYLGVDSSPSLHHHCHKLLSSMGASGTNMLNMKDLGHHRTRQRLKKKKCKCRLVLH